MDQTATTVDAVLTEVAKQIVFRAEQLEIYRSLLGGKSVSTLHYRWYQLKSSLDTRLENDAKGKYVTVYLPTVTKIIDIFDSAWKHVPDQGGKLGKLSSADEMRAQSLTILDSLSEYVSNSGQLSPFKVPRKFNVNVVLLKSAQRGSSTKHQRSSA